MNVTPEIARVASGAAWSVAGTALVQALGLLTTILVARHVAPEAYGVVGMALVIVVFIGTVRDAGLTPAIASGRLAGEREYSTAHWALTALGGAAFALVFFLAPLVAEFFRTPLVSDVLRALSPTFLFGAMIVVPQGRLQHEGRYRLLAALSALSQIIVSLGVVGAIALRAGIWTLVVPGIISAALMIPAYWIALGRHPALVFDYSVIARFLREGLQLSASGILNYFARNADNVIIGRLNGERALGLYAFAYNLLVQPLGLFSHALAPVLLPAFGRVPDPERRSDALVRATVILVRLGAPFFVGGAMTAHVLVPLVFGAAWEPSVPLVRVLMAVGALQIVGPLFGSFVLSAGDAAFVLRWYIAAAIVSVALFAIGAHLGGPLGVSYGYAVFTAGVVAAMYVVLRRRFGLPLHGLLGSLRGLLRDLAAMAVAVLLVDWGARATAFGPVPHLGCMVVVGAAVYVGAFRYFGGRDLVLALAVLPRRVGQAGARLLGVDVN